MTSARAPRPSGPIDVRELIRAARRATAEVPAITDPMEDPDFVDPRFVRPQHRARIAEDSGTYAVVFKKGSARDDVRPPADPGALRRRAGKRDTG